MLASLLSALARREIDGDSCTFEICNIDDSFYGYRPSRAANIAFAAIFGFSLAAFVLQSFISRRFIGFSIAMILGTLCELIGYIGRILMYNNPWAQVSELNFSIYCIDGVILTSPEPRIRL